MSKIRQLDEHTINLIAAGEVIERAASVVKELVENSIDAESKNIKIYLVDSGINEIRVVDDGIGMDPVDAKLCVVPHATSKIQDEKDLFQIGTLGFRGEALASIVAVSSFRLISSTDGTKAIMYSLKGGTPMSEAIVAHEKGTEIIVKNLFFNTPARLQNLQSQSVELSYVTEYIIKTALANPDIAFTLVNNEKTLLQTYGSGDVLEVISTTMGLDVAKNMIKFFDNNGMYKISGYISNLAITRSSRNYIHIIINGRVVKNNNIVNSIIKGYETLLMTGKYPIVIINISTDLGMIDVNVHPAKLEVRFSEENSLCDMIASTIKRTLRNVDLSIKMEEVVTNNSVDDSFSTLDESINNKEQDLFSEDNEKSNLQVIEENDTSSETVKNYDYTKELADSFELDEKEAITYKSVSEEKAPIVEEIKEEFIQQQYSLLENDDFQDTKEELKEKLCKMYYIGQLFGTYILAQSENEFFVIDQHAAAERINYEKIILELKKDDNVGYDLLIPFNISFSLNDCILVKDHMNEINNIGILLEEFGSNTFVVRRIPVWIFRGMEKEFVEEIITKIIQNQKNSKVEFLNSLAKSLACKKSIKGNEFHSVMEIEYLLDDLSKADNPFTCPHGRPIIIRFNKSEIEKWFKRTV